MADYWNPTQLPTNTQSFGVDQNLMLPQAQPFNFNQQRSENEGLISGYQQALGSQEKIPSMASRLEGQYFIPQLREQVQQGQQILSGLGSQIRAVPGQIAGTTRESMVTEGQRSGMVQARQKPMLEAYNTAGTNLSQTQQVLSSAEQNMNTRMQYEIAQQKKDLEPWEWKYNLQNIMQAREMSGWSEANRMELDRLKSNLATGVGITEAEKDRAFQLEKQKQQYQMMLSNYEKQMEVSSNYSGNADQWSDW
jgi:hypothetical protein